MKRLKVVHINTYDGNGGAGKACMRLNEALNALEEVDSKVMVFYAFHRYPHVFNYAAHFLRKIRAVYHIFYERWRVKKYVSLDYVPFSLQKRGVSLQNFKLLKQADIIHLHWINHGFLNPKQLQKLQALNKPIVWTFHDSNAFTGGCHVRYDCVNFTHHCGHCPVLEEPGDADLSRQNAEAKREAYAQLNFSIIAPSRWMMKSVKMSSLLGRRTIYHIPNTLNERVFEAYFKADVKKKIGIPEHTFVILSGSMPSQKDAHKGAPYLMEALQKWSVRMQQHHQSVEIVFFGAKLDTQLPNLPFKMRNIGIIQEDQKLAEWYAAADIFVTPSIEDNLPNTVMESLSCGTPVLAFATGGIPDMVVHQVNGYIARYKDVDDLAQGFDWLYHHAQPDTLQIEARAKVLENYASELIAQDHLALYYNLIDQFHEPSE